MKNFFLTFLIIVLYSVGLNAQTKSSQSKGPGVLTFETDTHNFDTIEYEGNGVYEFKFKNTGFEPVIISAANGSCGCTVPTYPKDVPIKPGEQQIIKVTYDTKRMGSFLKSVTVQSNAKEPVKILTIKGYVKPKKVEQAFPTDLKMSNSVPYENK